MDIEVTALTADGRPAEIAARFTKPLEDRSLRWVEWRDGGYQPWTPPPVGAATELPAPLLQWPLNSKTDGRSR